jgi:hypothetical protein
MAEQEPDSTKTRGNLADFLWPLGGTFFGLFVIRIAMAQYQTFFNQNEWLLPVSVIVTAACWIIPLLLHNRAKRIYSAILGVRRGGAFLFAIIVIVAIAVLFFGGRTLLRSHLNHLRVLNQPMPPKNAPPPLVPPSGENQVRSRTPSSSWPLTKHHSLPAMSSMSMAASPTDPIRARRFAPRPLIGDRRRALRDALARGRGEDRPSREGLETGTRR